MFRAAVKPCMISLFLLGLFYTHRVYTANTCLIETRIATHSCPENFKFVLDAKHNGTCAKSDWPFYSSSHEVSCPANFTGQCVQYEYAESWNERNELIKTRSPIYKQPVTNPGIHRKLSAHGEFASYMGLSVICICVCMLLPIFLLALYPGVWARELYMMSFPLCE